MLSQIGDVLSGIWDFCTAVFNFVIETVKGLGDLAKNLLKIPSIFSTIFNNGVLPSIVVAGFVGCLTTMIILRVIGRDG